jgi:hypothetical protein
MMSREEQEVQGATGTTATTTASVSSPPEPILTPDPSPTLPTLSSSSTSQANQSSSSSSSSPPSAMFEVVHVLTSFHRNHERMKMLRVSLSVIRFLSILNLVYTLLGITLLVMALCTNLAPEFDDNQRTQFYKIGLTVSVFAPLASVVDLFALRGLQHWRRGHLLPWLALYGFFLLLIASHAITGVVHQGFKWTYFVLILCAFCLYSSWRHVFRQYHDMARDKPTPASLDQLAQQINQSGGGVTSESPPNDLPPKYEELGTSSADLPPPQYCDEMMSSTENHACAAASVVVVETETQRRSDS